MKKIKKRETAISLFLFFSLFGLLSNKKIEK